jgi:hypothetical protein
MGKPQEDGEVVVGAAAPKGGHVGGLLLLRFMEIGMSLRDIR